MGKRTRRRARHRAPCRLTCDNPPAWCEPHHIIHWCQGGPTAINNLVLLCPAHHSAVHHQGWTVTLDGDGLPTFRPPPWIDPTRTPRRHHRYHLGQLERASAGRAPPDE